MGQKYKGLITLKNGLIKLEVFLKSRLLSPNKSITSKGELVMSHNSKTTKSSTRTKMKSAQTDDNKAKNNSEDLSKLWKNKVFNSFKDNNPNKLPMDQGLVEINNDSQNLHEIFITFIDKLFDELIDLGYIYNESNRNTLPELTWTRPTISKEGLKNPSQGNNIVLGRLSTKRITLIIRGNEPNLKGYIIPVDRLISFSSNPNNFKPYLEIEIDTELLKWTLDNNILPKNAVTLIAKRIFEALTQAISNNEFPETKLKFADLSNKTIINNHIKEQAELHNQHEAQNEVVEEFKPQEFNDNTEDIESIKNKLLSKIDAGPQFWSSQKKGNNFFEFQKTESPNKEEIKPETKVEENSILTNDKPSDTVKNTLADSPKLETAKYNSESNNDTTLELNKPNSDSSITLELDRKPNFNETTVSEHKPELSLGNNLTNNDDTIINNNNALNISNHNLTQETKDILLKSVESEEEDIFDDFDLTKTSNLKTNQENFSNSNITNNQKSDPLTNIPLIVTPINGPITVPEKPVLANNPNIIETRSSLSNSNNSSTDINLNKTISNLNNDIEGLLKNLSLIGSQAFLALDYHKANKILALSSKLREFNENTNIFIRDLNQEIESIEQ